MQNAIESYVAEPKTTLGRFLVASRLITYDQLKHALALQRQVAGRLGEILVEMGMISESSLLQVLEAAG